MAELSKGKEGDKDSIMEDLIARSPGQHVVVTAIEHIYSKEKAMKFVREYAAHLMIEDLKFKGGTRRAPEEYIDRTEEHIMVAFQKHAESRGLGSRSFSKWTLALDQVRFETRQLRR
ncbi:MAG: hypothetical protein KGH94_03870 [Candidatus Micrarchaeota archaeon]|nr:hypothetical protein [Candidatus Micrarchaeota archaeon]